MAKKKSIKRFMPWWMKQHMRGRAKRAEVRLRDGDDCWHCGHPMRFGPPYNIGKAATLEHWNPRALGGTSAIENLRLCHVGCNRHLGANTPEQKERMRLAG
jgi:5-methylcytosine-specific restriction endonuclease McrA